MNKVVRFMFYFISVLVIGALYYFGAELGKLPSIIFNNKVRVFYMVAYPMCIGILLGMVGIILRPKTEKVEYDYTLALGLGIPLAYVTFQPLLLHLRIFLPGLQYTFNYPISGILFGFVLVWAIKGFHCMQDKT